MSPSSDKASQVIVDAKAGDDKAIIIASFGLGLMIGLFALGVYVVVSLKRKLEGLRGADANEDGGEAVVVTAPAGKRKKQVL